MAGATEGGKGPLPEPAQVGGWQTTWQAQPNALGGGGQSVLKGIQDKSDSGNKSAVGIPRETHPDSRKAQ